MVEQGEQGKLNADAEEGKRRTRKKAEAEEGGREGKEESGRWRFVGPTLAHKTQACFAFNGSVYRFLGR